MTLGTHSIEDAARRRAQLYELLGDLPPRDRPLACRVLAQEERAHYFLEKLVLDLNGIEEVPAYFVRPKNATGKLPCVLYNHAHGGQYDRGKTELIEGVHYLHQPPYAEALARAGYCALCIDGWCFGERHGISELDQFKMMLWNGQVMWGMMVYDSLRAFDYLLLREEVNASRIATMGISMGSTMAWWVAALEERIALCVDLCCLTDYQALLETCGVAAHGVYYYVPGLLKHFTAAQINALIAPRPHLGLAGIHDELTPPRGLDRIDAELKTVYQALHAQEAWRLERFDVGHVETPEMRAQVMEFLARWL